MITSFSVNKFRCLKNVSIDLTPLHVIIGPNDSGKSTLLDALANTVREVSGEGHVSPAFFTLVAGKGALSRQGEVLRFSPAGGFPYQVHGGLGPGIFGNEIRGARKLHLDPDDLRRPTHLIPVNTELTITERGRNLPGVYDAILSRGDDAFHKISDQVRRLFPTIKHLRMKAVTESTKTFEADLHDGSRVGAEAFSEGLLYYLAFAALPYLKPVSLLVVEEPENGLHPSRIKEVMRVLREMAEAGTQVIVATHSPLVVNEAKPDEVSVITRTAEAGTRVARLKDTPHFAERSKVYALGELWLSYADGELEAPLLKGTAAP